MRKTEAFAARPGGEKSSGVAADRESLVNVAWRITGDREQACDAVQDVLLKHLESPDKFTGASSLKTYLYRMVINRCVDMNRRRNRFTALREIIVREHRHAIEDVYEIKELVRKLLSDINPLYKVPFVLAEGEGLSYEEIAGILGITMNTVRSRIFRCRERLKKKLSAVGYPL